MIIPYFLCYIEITQWTSKQLNETSILWSVGRVIIIEMILGAPYSFRKRVPNGGYSILLNKMDIWIERMMAVEIINKFVDYLKKLAGNKKGVIEEEDVKDVCWGYRSLFKQ